MGYNKKIRSKQEVMDTLTDLDYYCKESNVIAKLVMLGGSAFLTHLDLKNESFRPTIDVDVNIMAVNDEKVFKEQLKKVNIDLVGGVMEVPPLEDLSNEKYLIELDYRFESIRVFIPDFELLACTKLFTKREKDLQDLKKFNIIENCDQERLFQMINEYKGNLLNPSDPDLNYHQLNSILKEKGI